MRPANRLVQRIHPAFDLENLVTVSRFTGTWISAVRAEFCSTIRESADNPVPAISTVWPRMLLQIRAGSTRHPFITTASEEPPPALDAVCDAHAAKAVAAKRSKTSKLRIIVDVPQPGIR